MHKLKIIRHIKSIVYGSITLFFIACSASFGEKYTFKNLEIYYTPPAVNERYVEGLAHYFNQHNLILPTKHSVQLTSDEESYVLKMVLDKKFKTFPADKTDDLKKMEASIKKEVFNDLNFKIVICNANFVPIENH